MEVVATATATATATVAVAVARAVAAWRVVEAGAVVACETCRRRQ